MKPSTSFSACISRPECLITAVMPAVITAAAQLESAARAQEQRGSITRAQEGKLMPVAGADRAGS